MTVRITSLGMGLGLVWVLGAILPARTQAPATPTLVSTAAIPRATASADSLVIALSADGRFAVLASTATDLAGAPGDGRFTQLYRWDSANQELRLITVATNGGAGSGHSSGASISDDGRWVVFESDAPDLVAGDVNLSTDVFLRAVENGKTTLVSLSRTGTGSATGRSYGPVMSPDGRFVTFLSTAADLVTGVTDANNLPDVFLYSVTTKEVRLLSKRYRTQASPTVASSDPALSPDGTRVAFLSKAPDLSAGTPGTGTDTKLYLHDIAANTNLWASRGATNYDAPVPLSRRVPSKALFSGDGQYLLYAHGPLILRFRPTTQVTERVATNRAEAGMPGFGGLPFATAAAGDVVAFLGTSLNAMTTTREPDGIYVWRLATGTGLPLPLLVAPPELKQLDSPAVSGDGRFVGYLAYAQPSAMRTNALYWQAYRHDRQTGLTQLVREETGGLPELSLPYWSRDVAWLAFSSSSPDLVTDDRNNASDAFRVKLDTSELQLLSRRDPNVTSDTALGANWLRPQCLSADGQRVVFTSAAADLAGNDRNSAPDVFVHDFTTGSNILVSVNLAGTGPGSDASQSPVISADGRFVAFISLATNLVANDSNGVNDVFVRDLQAGTTVLASAKWDASGPGSGSSTSPSISADGRWITYESRATDLVAPPLTDANGARPDVFVFDRVARTNQLASIRLGGAGTGDQASGQPVMAPNGQFVLFQSTARNLVTSNPSLPSGVAGCFVRNLVEQTTAVALDPGLSGPGISPRETWPVVVSADSRAFAVGGTNTSFGGIIVNRAGSSLLTRSLPRGENPSLSADGQRVAYSVQTSATAVRQVYVQDLVANTTNLVSVAADGVTPGTGASSQPVIGGDGRYVVFMSLATNLVAGTTSDWPQIYVRDLTAGATLLLSAGTVGLPARGQSSTPVMAADGRTVAFLSHAPDLAARDSNQAGDIFVLRLSSGPVSDSDHDGLPDDWELAFFNTLDRDGTGDFDEDGASDRDEYWAGTDPSKSGSVFRALTLANVSQGTTTVLWSAVAGRTYRVQYKDQIGDPAWMDLAGDVTAASATGSKLDGTGSAGPQRYYRVLLVK